MLTSNPDVAIYLVGHTDDVGALEYATRSCHSAGRWSGASPLWPVNPRQAPHSHRPARAPGVYNSSPLQRSSQPGVASGTKWTNTHANSSTVKRTPG
jgi:hypothetical protein